MAKRSIRRHIARAVSVGRAAGQGIKGTGLAMAGGAVAAGITYAVEQNMRDTSGKLTQIGEYLPMGVAIIGGHFLKRFSPAIGDGLIGAGGYQAGQKLIAYLMAPKTATKGLVEPRQVNDAFRAGLQAGSANVRVLPAPNPLNAAPSAGAPTAAGTRRSAAFNLG